MKVYIQGVHQFDEGYELIQDRHEIKGTLEEARGFARGLLRDVLSGVVLIVDGDYVEQIGEYEGDIEKMVEDIDEEKYQEIVHGKGGKE